MLLRSFEFRETLLETANERYKIEFLMNLSAETLSSIHKLTARANKSQLRHEVRSLNATRCVLVWGSMQPKGDIVFARLASHNDKINARFFGSPLANQFELECLVKILHMFIIEFSLFWPQLLELHHASLTDGALYDCCVSRPKLLNSHDISSAERQVFPTGEW